MEKNDIILAHRRYIGAMIRELREFHGDDQKTLARKSGLDAANLCRIEAGKYSIGIDILFRILDVYNYRIELMFEYDYPSYLSKYQR